jgi:hypothetical protein
LVLKNNCKNCVPYLGTLVTRTGAQGRVVGNR